MISLGPALRSDVLILPHHGSWEDTLPAFVQAVDPDVVLVSCAREPNAPARYLTKADRHTGKPLPQQFYEDLRANRQYYSTAGRGYIRLHFGAAGIRVRTMR
jgi:beta-lactamase superfamily II metal-dependent hydrolase